MDLLQQKLARGSPERVTHYYSSYIHPLRCKNVKKYFKTQGTIHLYRELYFRTYQLQRGAEVSRDGLTLDWTRLEFKYSQSCEDPELLKIHFMLQI